VVLSQKQTSQNKQTAPASVFILILFDETTNMSLDAGGLAQMTYNNNNSFPVAGGIGIPNAGYASRGKGSQLKPLNVVSPIAENSGDPNPTPRTSRGHLLAGLRTAPKGQAPPASAPYNRLQHRPGPDGSKFAHQGYGAGQAMPQTAVGSTFQMNSVNANLYQRLNAMQQSVPVHEHVLAPPPVQLSAEDEHVDPYIMSQLIQTEAYLIHRQKLLQQQLLSLTSQQLQNMNLNGNQLPFQNAPMPPHSAMLNQQHIQPTVQEVPGQAGLYAVYNPVTGECSYVRDPRAQQQQQPPQLSNSPPPPTPTYSTPPRMQTPAAHQTNPASPVESSVPSRNPSPPKKTPSPPLDVQPLPPPSANAFRRGHKLNKSVISEKKAISTPESLIKSASRISGLPQTPLTGTFGPGQQRAGEHPVRQPRGPPQLEELIAKPTSKHEGSPNFVTRQRRSAVSSLVRKGIQRRSVRTGSGDSIAAGSEPDNAYYLTSDDSDSVHSNSSQSRKISVGTIRSHASGIIGSERKARRDRSWEQDRSRDVRSRSNGAGRQIDRPFSILDSDNIVEEPSTCSTPGAADRMKTPLLVFTQAEKRKTSIF
jgi:hypothetical protein